MNATTLGVFFGVILLAGGLGLILLGFRQTATEDPTVYLRGLDEAHVDIDQFEQRLSQPFVARAMRPLGTRFLHAVAGLMPANYLDSLHEQLLQAGLAGAIRAEEFATAQALAILAGLVVAVAYTVSASPKTSYAVLLLILLPGAGALGPSAWLRRTVAERKDAIFRDLPDILDLLAISVEAGLGFEQALDVVCTNFTSQLADEFSRSLKEMELGLPRREALLNLKRRTEVPELSNFVLALTQADVLGLPIARVLHTQALELRIRRRQWAREKASKLPVKILFPLVLFIFPAILVVILGPAGASIIKGLGR